MVVSCISESIKDDLMYWSQDRINTLDNVKKLHRGLLKEEEVNWEYDEIKKISVRRVRKKPMSREGYEAFKDTIDDAIINYTSFALEFLRCPSCDGEDFEELFETIKCMPREIKQDLVPYLRGRSKTYTDTSLSAEARALADLFMNRVANCTDAGQISYPWLHRRGYKKSDLVSEGNIMQIP